ncbi:Conjugal transfer protein, partial [Dysosmobacter welbionis]
PFLFIRYCPAAASAEDAGLAQLDELLGHPGAASAGADRECLTADRQLSGVQLHPVLLGQLLH